MQHRESKKELGIVRNSSPESQYINNLSPCLYCSGSRDAPLLRTLNIEKTLHSVSSCLGVADDFENNILRLAKILSDYFKVEGVIINIACEDASFQKVFCSNTGEDYKLYRVSEVIELEMLSRSSPQITFIEDTSAAKALNDKLADWEGPKPRAFAASGIFNKYGWIGYIAIIDFSFRRKWESFDAEVIMGTIEEIIIGLSHYNALETLKQTVELANQKSQELEKSLQREKELNLLQSDFIATASHEFRTPLAIIDSAAQMLEIKNDPEREYIFKQADKIRKNVSRMSYLMERTLELSALETGKTNFKPEYISIEVLLADIVSRFKEASPNRDITTEILNLPKQIYADAKLLDHAISNVICNAHKYSDESSMIILKTNSDPECIEIQVVDYGMGIPEEDIKNLFEKFVRGRNTQAVPGTGIGLYLSNSFIKMHKGKILVNSAVGKGTTVTIRIPVFNSKEDYDQNSLH